MASHSTLADTGAAHHYLHPVWRFGRVLQTPAGQALPVSQALEMGELFKPGKASASRYFSSRMKRLGELVTESGAQVIPNNSCQITVTYSFVPIVSFPELELKQGGATWKVREGITVCGIPSKSKIWLRAALTSWQGKPTDSGQISARDLEEARSDFDGLMRSAIDSLIEFYRGVLSEDVQKLDFENRVEITELSPFAEVEIVGLTVAADLDVVFDDLEERGFKVFCASAEERTKGGASEVLDFIRWAKMSPGGAGNWKPRRPKMLDLFTYVPNEDSARALVLPKEEPDRRLAWYGLIGERYRRPDGKGFLFTGDHAARILAQEYGRCF